MTATQVTIYAIIFLCFLLIAISFSKQLKFIFNFLLRASFGVLSFSIVNLLFASNGIGIALNTFTVCISGFLGLYGIIAIILSNIIL